MTNASTNFLGTTALLAAAALACGPLGCIASSESDEDSDSRSNPSTVAPSASQLAAQGYVRTPTGFYHKSCVHEVEAADEVDTITRTIKRADGRLDHVDTCTHPVYRTDGSKRVMVPDDASDIAAEDVEAEATGEGPEATTNGWKEAAHYLAKNAMREIKAEWTVPPRPNAVNGQTIFFFPGLEPKTGVRILQPVLQFGSSAAGGGNYWAIASWSCGDPCFHTVPRKSAAGHKIKGIVAGSGCANGACDRWDIGTYDLTNGRSTVLVTQNDPHHYRWVFGGALEVYDVSKCSEYPDAAFTRMHDIGVFNMNLDKVATHFGSFVSSATPNGCGFDVGWSNANHWVKLSY